MSWVQRWLERRNQIARGADAQLFAENARRFRWWAALLVAGCLLSWLDLKLPLAHAAHIALNIVVFILLGVSVFLFRWAQAQDSFLRRPDPEDPPSIFKK